MRETTPLPLQQEPTMNLTSPEAAYSVSRIKRSTDLARASNDASVRLAHEGIAEIYRKKLATPTQRAPEICLVGCHDRQFLAR